MVEFSGGQTSSNPLPYHEAYFYILEAVPMLLAILAFNIIHPSSVLVGPDSEVPGLRTTIKEMMRKRTGKALSNKSSGEIGLV
jgi:RTA1 like protein